MTLTLRTYISLFLFFRNVFPKVKLTVCRRANKTVTLVDNLDIFNIPAADFSQRIQKEAACHSAGGNCIYAI